MDAIPLPDAKHLHQLFRYDPETGRLWRISGKARGKEAAQNHRQVWVDGKLYLKSRIIWKMVYGSDPTGVLDHEDGDNRNNRILNLRDTDFVGNGQNKKRSTRNTSGIVGVSYMASTRKWRAYIRARGQFFWLGLHETMESAVAARKAALIEHGFHPNHDRHGPTTSLSATLST